MVRSTLLLLVFMSLAAPAAVAAGAQAPLPFALPPPSATPPPRSPSSADSFDLLVAATTDVHGRLRGWDYYANAPDSARGLSRAATIVDSLREVAPGRVVLVDAGDLLQGNPLTYVAARVSKSGIHPVMAAMNAVEYDAAAIGNHEFNYGVLTLDSALAQAHFPFLSANAYTLQGRRAFRGWHIVRRGPINVGIVGATTPGAMVWDRENLRGRLAMRDIVPEVRRAVAEVRREGADVVVVVLHSGLDEPSSYDTISTGVPSENVSARVAREVPGIDLIVHGHSHRELADTTIGGALIMQPKNWATSVAVAHLTLRTEGDRWHVAAKRGGLVQAARHAESEEVLKATREAHEETVAYVTTPIGATAVAWQADSARVVDSPITDFVLEVQRRTAGTDLAATAAFATDASIPAGPITIAQLARLYPYDNTLVGIRITGRQLRRFLEHSARYFGTAGTEESAVNRTVPGYNFDIVAGANYTIDLAKPVGSRITRLEVNGRPVRDGDSFTIALNNYRATGGGGFAMLSGAPVVYDAKQDLRQLLIDELRRKGTISPEEYATRNWKIVPAAAVSSAYEAIHENRPARAARAGAPATVPVGGVTGRRLRIVSTNDFHGALEPRPDSRGVMRGGAARMATAIERAAEGCREECTIILLDGGDMFQGTPASNLAYGRPVVELYHLLGTTAAALGNHEFDWGQDTLRARMRQARFAILGANVRDESGRDVPWIRNDTLVEGNGIKIGIIGLATVETPKVTKRSNVRGLRFVDPAPVVDSHARELRRRGADVIVVIAHIGAQCDSTGQTSCSGEIIQLAQRVTERVDAIVSGHTHTQVETVVNGIPIVQARSSGRAIGILDLAIGGARVAVDTREILTDALPASPRVDSLVNRAVAAVASRVSRFVAEVAESMPRSGEQYALGNLIADAQRWAGRGDIAIMNNGGIRADLRAGPATYGSLFEIQPFGNSLYRVTASGRALRGYFDRLLARSPRWHVSGIKIRYDSTAGSGRRVVSIVTDDGRALSDGAYYSVIMNDFMATGGEAFAIAGAKRSEPLEIADLDGLTRYLAAQPGPVRPPTSPRIMAVTR